MFNLNCTVSIVSGPLRLPVVRVSELVVMPYCGPSTFAGPDRFVAPKRVPLPKIPPSPVLDMPFVKLLYEIALYSHSPPMSFPAVQVDVPVTVPPHTDSRLLGPP